jgi:hypothetical protein
MGPIFWARVLIKFIDGATPNWEELLPTLAAPAPLNLKRVEVCCFKSDVYLSKPLWACVNSIGLSFFVREGTFVKDVPLAPTAAPPNWFDGGAWGYYEVLFEFDVLFYNAA